MRNLKKLFIYFSKYFDKELIELLILTSFIRSGIFLVMFFSRIQAGYYEGLVHALKSSMDILFMWDSGWYLDIVENGYRLSQITEGPMIGQANYAFFPLLPILTKILGIILFGNYKLVGLIITISTSFIVVIYLYKLVKLLYDKEKAISATQYLIVFPTSFLLIAFLSESLFLALLCMTLYYSYKDNWKLAIVLAVLTTLTRSVGMFVGIPMLFAYFKNNFIGGIIKPRKLIQALFKPNILSLLLIPLSLIAFMLYISSITGNLFSIFSIQEAWGRYLTNPFRVLSLGIYGQGFNATFSTMFALLCIILLLIGIRKVPIGIWIMGFLFIFIPVVNSPNVFQLYSFPRYVLVVIPMYLILANFFKLNSLKEKIVFIIFLIFQVFLAIQWTMGSSLVV